MLEAEEETSCDDFIYKCPGMELSCFSSQLEFKNNGKFCDVILKVADKEIPAHKVILASSSPFFDAMFQENNFCESNEKIVKMQGIDPDILEQLVNLSYGAEIKINSDNVVKLLIGADYLQLNDIKNGMADYLKASLNSKNVFKIRHMAEKYTCYDLIVAVEEFIELNFVDLTNTEDFLKLDQNELISIINKDKLSGSEEKVYEAVIKWVKYAQSNRLSFLPMILSHVKMDLLSPQYLNDVVRNERLMGNSLKCKRQLEAAIFNHLICATKNMPGYTQSRSRNEPLNSE